MKITELIKKANQLSPQEKDKASRDELWKDYFDQLDKHPSNSLDNICIKKIQFFKYKLFINAEIEFDFPLTIFVGTNGKGKTTILDSIAKHLSWIAARASRKTASGTTLREEDISNLVDDLEDATVSAEFSLGEKSQNTCLLKGSLSKAKPFRSNPPDQKLEAYTAYGEALRQQREYAQANFGSINLPLFAYYSIERTADMHMFSAGTTKDSRLTKEHVFSSALLGKNKLKFTDFAEWLLRQFKSIEAQKNNYEKQKKYQKPIRILTTALEKVIPEFKAIRFSQEEGKDSIIFDLGNSSVSFDQLSDGQRIFVGLVADLAWRLITLNPLTEAPLQGHGIVLIDEVELHLHPTWQQQIIPNLLSTFPNIQFIITTHSPHVLSTVDNKSIRLLSGDSGKEAKIIYVRPAIQTKGKRSSDVLEAIMGTHSRPSLREAAWLDECYEALCNDTPQDLEHAKQILASIKSHFGERSSEYLTLYHLFLLKTNSSHEIH